MIASVLEDFQLEQTTKSVFFSDTQGPAVKKLTLVNGISFAKLSHLGI